jgi:hypothetical protein
MNTTCGERFARIETKLDHIEKGLAETSSEVKGLRWWILGTVLSGVLAIIGVMIGFGQFQASWFQHSLEANRDTANKTEARVEKIQEGIDAKFDKLIDRFTAPPAKQ